MKEKLWRENRELEESIEEMGRKVERQRVQSQKIRYIQVENQGSLRVLKEQQPSRGGERVPVLERSRGERQQELLRQYIQVLARQISEMKLKIYQERLRKGEVVFDQTYYDSLEIAL